jgi:hypothetical protein
MNTIKTILISICIILATAHFVNAESMEDSITAPRKLIAEVLGILPILFIMVIGAFLVLVVQPIIFIPLVLIFAGIPLIIFFGIPLIITIIISLPILFVCFLAIGILLFALFIMLFVVVPLLPLIAIIILIGIVVAGIIAIGLTLVFGAIAISIGVWLVLIIFGSIFALFCPPIVCLSGVLILQMLKEKAEQEVKQCLNIAFCGLLDYCPQ